MNVIQIQRVPHRQGDEGVAGQKFIVRSIGGVGPFQHPDPLRIAHLEISGAQTIQEAVQICHPAAGLRPAVAVQVEVIAEFPRARLLVGNDEHRRTRAVKKIGQVLQRFITSQ